MDELKKCIGKVTLLAVSELERKGYKWSPANEYRIGNRLVSPVTSPDGVNYCLISEMDEMKFVVKSVTID